MFKQKIFLKREVVEREGSLLKYVFFFFVISAQDIPIALQKNQKCDNMSSTSSGSDAYSVLWAARWQR